MRPLGEMRMNKFKVLIAAIISILVMVPSVAFALPVDFIQNGDFEWVDDSVGKIYGYGLNELSSSKKWDVYDALPGGWYTGDGEAGIEIQYTGTVVAAHSGQRYVELDSHGGTDTNSSLSQDMDLVAGEFLLSFYYRARTDTQNDNGIEIWFGDKAIGQTMLGLVDGVKSDFPGWTLYSFSLDDVSAGLHTLTFKAVGNDNTLGGLLDSVSLVHTPVPVPAAVWLFGSGLIGLVALKRSFRA